MGVNKVEIHRAVPSLSYRFYDNYTQQIRDTLPDFKRWKTQEYTFPNGAPFFKFLKPDDYKSEKRPHFILPIWVSGKMKDSLFALQLSMNSLTRNNKGIGDSLAEGVTVLAPYLEMRMDKSSEEAGEIARGEAVSAEIIANSMEGASRLITANLHSREAFEAIQKKGVEVINVSLVPSFVQEAKDRRLIDERTVVVASDIGSLQMSLEFAHLCDLDIKTQVVVLDKGARDQDRNTKGLRLMYGEENLNSKSVVIQLDDIHDTGGSVDDAEKLLSEKGVQEIYQFFTHGVFSYPADVNVVQRFERGVVKELWKSDTLPQSKYQLNADERIHTIETARLLSWIAVTSVDWPVDALKKSFSLGNYISDPREKIEVWKEFAEEVGEKWEKVLE